MKVYNVCCAAGELLCQKCLADDEPPTLRNPPKRPIIRKRELTMFLFTAPKKVLVMR